MEIQNETFGYIWSMVMEKDTFDHWLQPRDYIKISMGFQAFKLTPFMDPCLVRAGGFSTTVAWHERLLSALSHGPSLSLDWRRTPHRVGLIAGNLLCPSPHRCQGMMYTGTTSLIGFGWSTHRVLLLLLLLFPMPWTDIRFNTKSAPALWISNSLHFQLRGYVRFVFEQVFGLNPDGRLGIEVSWSCTWTYMVIHGPFVVGVSLGEPVCGVPDFAQRHKMAQGRTVQAK